MTDNEQAPLEEERRWHLILGGNSEKLQCQNDQRLGKALDALYNTGNFSGYDDGKSKKGGHEKSAPSVATWLGDIREFFPSSVVQLVQQDAFDRLGLKQMLTEPEFLLAVKADVHLVADLVSLNNVMPEKTLHSARIVIDKVVQELMKRLTTKTAQAIRGAVNKSKRSFRPRFNDIDWGKTILANLRHYQAEYKTVIPEKLIGFERQTRRTVDLDEIILCIDQSGSMATSVVYSSIFAAVLASLPSVKVKLVCFDTVIDDKSEQLDDPVSVLMGIQMGGGTDINQAVAYCESIMDDPKKAHLVLITDLYEGGDQDELVSRANRLIENGVNLITLLALSDDGKPSYDNKLAAIFAKIGSPTFGCTPDQFPDLMATALKREDIHEWAANHDIKMIRAKK